MGRTGATTAGEKAESASELLEKEVGNQLHPLLQQLRPTEVHVTAPRDRKKH